MDLFRSEGERAFRADRGPAFSMTSAGGRRGFMIAVCDTSACTFDLKPHADVSLTAILGALPGAGTPDRTQNAKSPSRNTRDRHSGLQIVTRRECDVALGVIGPAAGFRGSGVDGAPRQDRRK